MHKNAGNVGIQTTSILIYKLDKQWFVSEYLFHECVVIANASTNCLNSKSIAIDHKNKLQQIYLIRLNITTQMSLLLTILVHKYVFLVVNLVQKLQTKKKNNRNMFGIQIYLKTCIDRFHIIRPKWFSTLYNWETYWLMRTIHTIETYF